MSKSHQIRACAAAGVLAAVLAAYGCGSTSDAETSSTATGTPARATTPEPAASLPGTLRGRWRRTMTAGDWRAAGGGYPVGTFRFTVDAKGAVSVYFPHTAAVDFTTSFVASGEQLTIDSVPVCPGQTGRYTWRSSAKALKLTVVRDACSARAALFGGTWARTTKAPQ